MVDETALEFLSPSPITLLLYFETTMCMKRSDTVAEFVQILNSFQDVVTAAPTRCTRWWMTRYNSRGTIVDFKHRPVVPVLIEDD